MTLNISNALKAFDLADYVDLDCGEFDLRIKQAAVHNMEFRAAVTKRSMASKRKSLVPEKGSLTGSLDQDVALFAEMIVVGWGARPLKDDEGNTIEYSVPVAQELFTSTREGRVLFGKVQQAAVSDEMFLLGDEDLGNS